MAQAARSDTRGIAAAGNDKLTGNAMANVLDGGAGDDVIAGLAGTDTLIGGFGDDSSWAED